MSKEEILKNLRATEARMLSVMQSNDRLQQIQNYINKDNSSSIAKKFFYLLFLGLSILMVYAFFFESKTTTSKTGVFILSIVLVFIISALSAFFLSLILYLINSFNKKIRLKNSKPDIEKEFLNIKTQLESCAKESIMPEKYRNLHSLSKIIEYFENYRVDSIKEGINLFEDEALRLENIRHLRYMAEQQNIMIKNQGQMIRNQSFTNFLLVWNKHFR